MGKGRTILRVLVVLMLVLVACSSAEAYAGLSKARAISVARTHVIRVDYRGDTALFHRNTGNRPTVVRRSATPDDRPAWFIRFDDWQAMRKSCVTVRGDSSRVIACTTHC